jgi:hypothetical protein
LVDIEDAEHGRLKEPPWCFTKTQFGPVEGHVALVEMLAALKREFLPELDVSDEGQYWETRNLGELVRLRSLTQQAIDGLAEGLRRHGLSREAAEDSSILLRHIERVAEKVHRILRRPAEHPPVAFDGDDFGGAADPEATEKLWDEISKRDRRQQERMQRTFDELRSRGVDDETAFKDALADVVPDIPDEETERSEEPWTDDDHAPFGESLEDDAEREGAGSREADDDQFDAEMEERHPLLRQAMDLLVRFDTLFPDADQRFASSLRMLNQGAGDVMGGLAQALAYRRDEDDEHFGLCLVQLKRTLRGAAFARGALFPLRSTISAGDFDELFRTLQQMETDIVCELGKVRFEHRDDDS